MQRKEKLSLFLQFRHSQIYTHKIGMLYRLFCILFSPLILPMSSHSIKNHSFFKTNLFILLLLFFWLHWVFVAVHGLFSGCSEWGLLFIVVRRLLIAVASLVAEHGLQACGLR